jgi:hypothetical protein
MAGIGDKCLSEYACTSQLHPRRAVMKPGVIGTEEQFAIRALDPAELDAVSGAGTWRDITNAAARGLETVDLIAHEISKFVVAVTIPQCK